MGIAALLQRATLVLRYCDVGKGHKKISIDKKAETIISLFLSIDISFLCKRGEGMVWLHRRHADEKPCDECDKDEDTAEGERQNYELAVPDMLTERIDYIGYSEPQYQTYEEEVCHEIDIVTQSLHRQMEQESQDDIHRNGDSHVGEHLVLPADKPYGHCHIEEG